MKLHSLKTRGVGMPFRESEVSIDFDALPDGLVALVGDNGSGKSHLLELSGPATLFRELASYGESFVDHVAPGVRDAFSEVIFSIGPDRFRALVQADPSFGGRGKNEAYLFRAAGEDWTPVAGPLVREYDAAIAQATASKEMFLASVFACQGGEGSFFGLAKAQRKDLFGAMLGLAHLQEKSEVARTRGQRMVQQLDRVRDDSAAAKGRQERANVLGSAIEAKAEALAALDTRVTTARDELDKAQEALGAAKDSLARAEAEAAAAERDKARVEGERDQAQQKVGALSARLDQINATLEGADDVRGAVARLATLDEEIRAAQAEERDAIDRLRPIDAEVAKLEAQRVSLVESHRRVTKELASAKEAEARVAAASTLERDMADQKAQLAKAIEELEAVAAAFSDAETAAEAEAQLVDQRRALEARRSDLSPRRTLLTQIPGAPECEGCPLTAEARHARDTLVQVEADLALLPAVTQEVARSALRALRERERRFSGQRALAQQWIAENAPKLERLAIDREDARRVEIDQRTLSALTGEGTAVRAQLDEQVSQGAELGQKQAAARERIAALTESRHALAEAAGRLEAITAAEAQRGEVDAALSSAKASAMAAAAALDELPAIDVSAPKATAEAAEAERARATERLTNAEAHATVVRGELAKLTGERDALGDPTSELAALRDREALLARDAADWSLLERALGRDGVQALAIDAAGPTVSRLANDLLSACYGPRFSLSLETTAQTKDGKKQREVFDVRILDAEAGREAKQGSGGEMVLLDEALRLALAIFNTQRSGVPLLTLWRDETTGALSPDNADRYVAMLRRAMELGGFERCLFVAHQRSVWEQADARIFIANGTVSIDDGALEAA